MAGQKLVESQNIGCGFEMRTQLLWIAVQEWNHDVDSELGPGTIGAWTGRPTLKVLGVQPSVCAIAWYS